MSVFKLVNLHNVHNSLSEFRNCLNHYEKERMIFMKNFEIILEKEEEYLLRLNQEIDQRIKKAPEGSLRCCKKRNKIQYYHRTKDMENLSKILDRYIKKEEMDQAKLLAQKGYDKCVKEWIENCLNRICLLRESYQIHELEKIYENLNDYRKELVTPIFLSDEDYAKQWLDIDYPQKGFKEDAPEIFTEKGERVRSKSEKIIADKFYIKKIPYRYEYPVSLKDYGTVHPDFIVLNKRTRKEYLWEHLGMMDNIFCILSIRLYSMYGLKSILEFTIPIC